MSDRSKIEWTDATWNPVTGCSVVSPGCTNCYAMRLAGTRLRDHPSRAGLTVDSKAGPVWTGEVRLNEQWLDQPLRWKKPRRIFVCAHGDLFHENVPDEWIDRVWRTMKLAPRHAFQVLTKRPARARAYLSDPLLPERIAYQPRQDAFPLPNVWLGVSVEDQARADERIPHLLATPAAVRFVSAEPLLGPVDLTNLTQQIAPGVTDHLDALDAVEAAMFMNEPGGLPALDWVIAGGESGPNARPMHPDWVRSLRDQCAAAGVPFHFKQWGEWSPVGADDRPDWGEWLDADLTAGSAGLVGNIPMWRVGKARAGRLLDGVEHDGFPGSGEPV